MSRVEKTDHPFYEVRAPLPRVSLRSQYPQDPFLGHSSDTTFVWPIVFSALLSLLPSSYYLYSSNYLISQRSCSDYPFSRFPSSPFHAPPPPTPTSLFCIVATLVRLRVIISLPAPIPPPPVGPYTEVPASTIFLWFRTHGSSWHLLFMTILLFSPPSFVPRMSHSHFFYLWRPIITLLGPLLFPQIGFDYLLTKVPPFSPNTLFSFFFLCLFRFHRRLPPPLRPSFSPWSAHQPLSLPVTVSKCAPEACILLSAAA